MNIFIRVRTWWKVLSPQQTIERFLGTRHEAASTYERWQGCRSNHARFQSSSALHPVPGLSSKSYGLFFFVSV